MSTTTLNLDQIAGVAYNAQRAACSVTGADSLPAWEDVSLDLRITGAYASARSVLESAGTQDSLIGWADGTGPNIPAPQPHTPELPGHMAFEAVCIALRPRWSGS